MGHLRLLILCLLITPKLWAQGDQIAGTYKALLIHEETNFYQYAKLTLRTVNVGGETKISASAKVLFGDWNSNEFLTYEYPATSYDFLTGRLTLSSDVNDVTFTGVLRSGVLKGDWFAAVVGRVGTFSALKSLEPVPPEGATLVRTLSGYYRGTLKNENPDSNLPERLTMSFVTTQSDNDTGPTLKVTGNVRFYLGDFGSPEYFETRLTDINFNFYNRYLTAKTEAHGITFKGTMTLDGLYSGDVFSDNFGEVGTFTIKRFP